MKLKDAYSLEEVMTNLDSILKSRDITLPIKVHLVKAMVFPVVIYRFESWTVKKAEHRRIDAFELWCWRRLSRVQFSSVQFSHSVVSSSLWPHESQQARPPCPITNSQSSPKPMSIESVMLFSHLILCRPLLLLPPIPPSIRVFSNESTLCMRWPNYWSFSFNISPSNEYPKLISFRMDWLDFLAVHGTLKIGAQLTL